MTTMDLRLIKMDTSHYYLFDSNLQDKVVHNGRVFFNRFAVVHSLLSADVIKQHLSGSIMAAFSLIKDRKVENIVIDYNGTDDAEFYHKAQILLRKEGFLNWTAYRSKTRGHLHIYIHKGHTDLSEATFLAKTLGSKLERITSKQWRIFPNSDVPPSFNILVLPYDVYAKERGSYWSKHL